MIEFKSGDILHEDAEALINTVNCVGVMGRGIALQFKNAFPENFKAYVDACKKEQVKPGKMFVFETGQLTNPLFLINFPTKRHWKGKSRIEDIVSGLEDLVHLVKMKNISSIAIPPLGSGLGGLNWDDVKPLIVSAFTSLDEVHVKIFEPAGAPSCDIMAHKSDVPKMTPGRAALVELIQRYLKGLMDPTVSLLEVHKLMYFMQESGEALRLKFHKAIYGPYAENLRHVLHAIEGHMIVGYSDGGDIPDKQIALVPGAVEEATSFLRNHELTQERFNRVSHLVSGFESSFGLELLSTVHWVAKNSLDKTADYIVHEVHNWSERKKQFTPRQIKIALNVLENQGWLNK